jgi:catalase-peroxidase
MDTKADDKSADKCPAMHTTIARFNRDWWPNQLRFD